MDELGYNKDAAKGEMGKLLKEKAFQGEIDRSQYQEALLQLYGISDPELIKRGKNILEFEDNNVTFFDGVRETLLKLKAEGFYLGIITDTAASTLYENEVV